MQRWMMWIGLAGVLAVTATPAGAQNFSTALPLEGADAADYEGRLANVLEFARPNQVTRFRLPSGRTVSVRSYQTTQITGSGPCRGYRVDLSGNGGFMAVDGFRCRDVNGNDWRLAEPETVLAQSGAPGSTGTAPGSTQRAANEPLYADDDLVGPNGIPVDANGNPIGIPAPVQTSRVVPVPRPRPEPSAVVASVNTQPTVSAPPAGLTETADRTILSSEPQLGEPAYVTQLRERIERARRLEEEITSAVTGENPPAALTSDTPDRTAAVITPSLPETAPSGDPFGDAPASTVFREKAPIAPALADDVAVAVTERNASTISRTSTSTTTRVVGARQTDEILGYAADTRIVAALKNLRYLSGGGQPSAAAVDKAVDEFATDERFALPIGHDALLIRLSDAQVRSSSLPECASAGDPAAICVVAQ